MNHSTLFIMNSIFICKLFGLKCTNLYLVVFFFIFTKNKSAITPTNSKLSFFHKKHHQNQINKYNYSSGIEGNPTVFYRLMPGSTAQTNKYHTFYLQQRQDGSDTWADIKVNHPLDYETIKEYNLTIRVEVSAMT